MPIDPLYYYRLTNSGFTDQVLEVNAENPGSTIVVDQAKPYNGQYWKLVKLSGEGYKLVTAYAGDHSPLIGLNPPHLGADGDPSNQQQWTLTESGYTCILTLSGKQLGIEQQDQSYRVVLQSPSDQATFRWTLTKLTPVNDEIPDLDLKGQTGAMTLGPTNYEIFKNPGTGTVEAPLTVKGVMVFVDFMQKVPDPTGADAQAAAKSAADLLLGANKVQELYRTQSYGKLTLQVDVKSDLGWKQPGDAKTEASFFDLITWESRRAYIAEAANLFAPKDVDFSKYDFVFIVPPKQATPVPDSTIYDFSGWAFAGSPGLGAPYGAPHGDPPKSSEIRWAAIFGTWIYSKPHPYAIFVHEMAHFFGLPDLYNFEGVTLTYPPEYTSAGVVALEGCWPVMGEWFYSESFLGWERHKMGWLDRSRTTYLSQHPLTWNPKLVMLKTGIDPLVNYCLQLSPLSDRSGLSMVVLPLDDALKPSKVLVIEVAQPVMGVRRVDGGNWVSDGTEWGEREDEGGVLLYTVDATIATGYCPLKIVPKKISRSDQYGDLFEAPFKPGDPAKTFQRGYVSITVKVLEQIGSSYKISIDRKYTTRSRITEFSQGLTPGSQPSDITLGPDGNLWFTENAGNQIGRIDSKTGAITEFSQGLTAGSQPAFITVGPDGNLWFTEYAGNQIGRITPSGDISEFRVPTAGSQPSDITAGPDGNLWFTEQHGNQIGRISPAGIITEFSQGLTPGSQPQSITAGPDGSLWFTEYTGNKIGRITPSGDITEFPLPTPNRGPIGITAGRDGNLWFTEQHGNQIGRISPAGVITEFQVPTADSGPYNITLGLDGNLWFTENAGNQIGRITGLGSW